jgi:hypothetical protein
MDDETNVAELLRGMILLLAAARTLPGPFGDGLGCRSYRVASWGAFGEALKCRSAFLRWRQTDALIHAYDPRSFSVNH